MGKTYVITSALVKFEDKYLIAKRSANKKFAPNQWEFISGFVDTKEGAENIILRELMEELKLKGKIIKSAEPYVVNDKEARWMVIPFLIKLDNNSFVMNKKDHSEVKFVTSKELTKYKELSKDINEFRKRGLI